MRKKFFIILLVLFILQCIIRFVPLIDNKTLPDLKKSEEEVPVPPVPQENLSDETEHIYCPSEDNADGITNTDHEWIYLN